MVLRCFENLRNRKSHIRDRIFHSLEEDRNYILIYLIFCEELYDLLKRHETTHSVVIPLLICIINLNNLRNKASHNPIPFVFLSKFSDLFNSCFSNSCSSVAQIREEYALELLLEDFFRELFAKLSNQLEHRHAYSPLSFFSHRSYSGQKCG